MWKSQPKPIPLNEIYFGKDDAESDFATGGLLKQGFLRTIAYEEALAGRKTLFVGRKGSGKSAICIMLHSALSIGNQVALVTPDEISADEIRRFGLAGISPESSKELIWRYVFAVQIAKFLLSRMANTKDETLKTHIHAISKFLRDNNEIEDLSAVNRFWKTIEKLKGKISFEAFSVKIGAEAESNHPSAGAFAAEQLDRLESHLKLAAESLRMNPENNKFYLLVDQVEKIWSNDPESNSMVIGLLLTAKRVSITFPFVRCTVFLRTDIYEKVRFQEGDKFRTDEFRLVWDERSLAELALTRAKASSRVNLTESQLWHEVFPAELDSESLPSYLISMTLMRPRDIIQLCNSCRYTAQANSHEGISHDDIRQATKAFSTWKLNDIQNEWLINYPFLPDVLLLLTNRTFLFTRASFASSLSLISGDLAQRYPNFGNVIASPDTLLQVLYSIGIIGVIRSEQPVYNYQVASDQKLELSDRNFIIHPAFRFSLQSELAIGATPFQFDADFLRERLRRGSRGVDEVFINPHYRFEGVDFLIRRLAALLISIQNLRSPEEFKRALVKNVVSVKTKLEEARYAEDELAVQLMLDQVVRYLSRLADTLKQGALDADGDFRFELNEVIRELRDLLGGGGRRRGAIST